MNTEVVEMLARLEVRDSTDFTEKARAFIQIHLNPAFGWHIAGVFARAKVRFPITAIGRDQWLFHAYMMRSDPAAFHNSDVETAFLISGDSIKSGILKALLIAGLDKPVDEHLRLVAEKTGHARRVVEAFEILFFNILDRPRDGAYISQIVYPEGRQVEFREDYFENTPVEELLLRAAYNTRDIDLVLGLAGMTAAERKHVLAAFRDQVVDLESRIMGNALLMARMGLINQPVVGLQLATKLLAARSSQAGVPNQLESEKPYDMAGELAAALASVPPITDADRKSMHAAARPGRSYFVDDNGKITSFDAAGTASGSTQTSGCPAGNVTWFPEPIRALWMNKDHDVPVILVAIMSEPGSPDYYLTDTKTGIPAAEVVFQE